MEQVRVGFAFCGSFCTYDQVMPALERAKARYGAVTPIISEKSADTDTRFGAAHEFMREMERICDRRVIDSIQKAEPIGPQKLLDVLVIAPCTGSTLARLANGFSDTSVTMAAKAMWRNGRPVVLAVSTNDGLSGSAKNIAALLDKKNVYFVPYRQDDPVKKTHLSGGGFYPDQCRCGRRPGGPAAPAPAVGTRRRTGAWMKHENTPGGCCRRGYSFVKGNGKDRMDSPSRKRGRIRRRVCATPPCGGQFPETWR